jgi:hypothetical protein
VIYRGPGSKAGNVTQIEVVSEGPDDASHVSHGLGSRSMTLNENNGANTFDWTAAHEFGHILGLKDRYVEGSKGGARTSTVVVGYSGNLMAEDYGAIESLNLRDLADENAPGWFDDDDQVRAWVGAHTPAEVGALSLAAKIKSITILMSGWISGVDVAAIVKICKSVTDPKEASEIRRQINPSEMNSFDQRAKVRTALNEMPI